MRKPRLMTPGPAMVPEDVLLELARPVIHHRSNESKQVMTEVVDGLKEVFQTQNDVLILTASGTGAMEAAVVNAVPPGGKALVLNAGHFAARWVNLCKAFGLSCVSVDTEWGQPVDPDRVAEALKQHSGHNLRVRHVERDFDRYGPPDRGDRPGRRRDAPHSWLSTASRASAPWSAAPTSGESTCCASARRKH